MIKIFYLNQCYDATPDGIEQIKTACYRPTVDRPSPQVCPLLTLTIPLHYSDDQIATVGSLFQKSLKALDYMCGSSAPAQLQRTLHRLKAEKPTFQAAVDQFNTDNMGVLTIDLEPFTVSYLVSEAVSSNVVAALAIRAVNIVAYPNLYPRSKPSGSTFLSWKTFEDITKYRKVGFAPVRRTESEDLE